MIQHNGQHREAGPDDAIADVERVRATAAELLRQLRDDRESCERRSVELSRVDPVKSITGAQAMDRAVLTLEQILEHLDAIAAGGSPEATREPVATRFVSTPRGAFRVAVPS